MARSRIGRLLSDGFMASESCSLLLKMLCSCNLFKLSLNCLPISSFYYVTSTLSCVVLDI